MSRLRGLLLVLAGGAAGGLSAVLLMPTAIASADDCTTGECTLVLNSNPDATDAWYSGFRPMFTDWKGTLPINVQVTPEDGTPFVSGSYDVTFQDYKTQGFDQTTYQYGDFTPAATNTAGIDSDGLAGVTVYDTTYGNLDALVIKEPDGTYYEVFKTSSYTETMEFGPQGSAGYIQDAGAASPTEMWNGLPDNSFPTVPDVMPPDPYDFDMP